MHLFLIVFWSLITMKKVLIGSTIAACTALALATPYYLGGQAQKSLEIQHQALANTFFFDVVSHNYDRGWFSSTETTVIRFHPTVLTNISAQLPDNIKTILSQPITLVNHVKHQPFANGIKPVRAVVDTDVQYEASVQKTLARFFGEQVPLRLHNVIELDGSGTLNVQFAPIEYEELSGIKLNWQGMTGDVRYDEHFNQYRTQFAMPALNAILADKVSLQLTNLQFQSETSLASNGKTTLGSSTTTLDKAEFVWKDQVNYNVRLNELINMVSDLQIGAFINPNGTIAPSHISVDKFSYATKTSEPETGFIQSEGQFTFAQLNYGDKKYGPLNIDVAAEHLHADSLNALKTRWQQIAASKPAEQEYQQQLLAAVRNEGVGIFTNNPVFKLKAFDLTTPTGHIKAAGSLHLNNMQASDLNDLSPFVAKMKAQLDLDISQNLIEDFAVQQTRGLFTVEDATSEQEQQEISDTIKMLTVQTLDTMTNDGYIKRENGAVQTQLNIADNKITLNGKPFQTQSDEDLFAGIEADDEVQAASAASAP
ncbi:Secreted protein [Kingella kingae]|nr:YdgA family protein [Kingella kingae]CRZ20303.1 Secreted protein [Kingella kingae]